MSGHTNDIPCKKLVFLCNKLGCINLSYIKELVKSCLVKKKL